MALIALEINNSGILAAGGSPPRLLTLDGESHESPGFALPKKKGLLVGKAAEGKAHIFPRQILHHYWDQLNSDPLEGTGKYYPQNNAEIVFSHLTLMWQQLQRYGDELVIAVPSYYNREHLGLMLGIAQELKIPLKGFVPLSLAASTQISPENMLLYLDIDLHRIEVIYLEQGEHLVLRDFASTAEKGLLHLYRKMVDMIGQAFVRGTRFDPLHKAATEQELYDRLPGILTQFQDDTSMILEISGTGRPYSIMLQRDSMIRQAEPVYNEIIRLVQRMHKKRGEGLTSLTLQLSHRLSRLPGCREMLATIGENQIIDLEQGAAAMGTLQVWNELSAQSNRQGISYFTSRPWQPQPQSAASRPLSEIDSQGTPTHLLYSNIAFPITEKPIMIGSAGKSEPDGLFITIEANGVAPQHCTVAKQGDDIILENLSNQATYIDETPVSGTIALKLGQTIRVGTFGEQLRLIVCLQNK